MLHLTYICLKTISLSAQYVYVVVDYLMFWEWCPLMLIILCTESCNVVSMTTHGVIGMCNVMKLMIPTAYYVLHNVHIVHPHTHAAWKGKVCGVAQWHAVSIEGKEAREIPPHGVVCRSGVLHEDSEWWETVTRQGKLCKSLNAFALV